MANPPRNVTPRQRTFGRIALLVVVLALIGNVAVFAWIRPYGILRNLEVIAEARERIHQKFVGEIDDQALIDAAIDGMANSLGDPNSEYLSAEDLAAFEEHFAGEFSGIGAEIDIHEDRLRLIAPLDDSPAWKAGVLPGDIVLEIDGKDTLGIDILSAMKQLKGKAGTDVTIKVRHRDGKIQTMTITRATIKVTSVRGYRRIPGKGYDYMIDPTKKIAYVRLTTFGTKSDKELADTLAGLKAKGMKALILDLRDNGGGLLSGAITISDLFLTEGKTIVSTKGRAVESTKDTSTQKTLLPDIPLVLLINENSASASEIVAGAMADNDRALLVGTRSYGKGSVQQLLELDGGKRAIKLTTAYWYIPSGRLIHKTKDAKRWGVDPSPGCYIPMEPEAVREMLIKRRSISVDDPFKDLDGPITPQWLRDEMLDPQMAAALTAAQTRLASGQWPKVGISVEEALADPSELEKLAKQRKELEAMLKQVNKQIGELESKAKANEQDGGEGAADDGTADQKAVDEDTPAESDRTPEPAAP